LQGTPSPEPLSLASSVIVDHLVVHPSQTLHFEIGSLPPFKLVELVLPANQRVSANACFHCPTPAPFSLLPSPPVRTPPEPGATATSLAAPLSPLQRPLFNIADVVASVFGQKLAAPT